MAGRVALVASLLVIALTGAVGAKGAVVTGLKVRVNPNGIPRSVSSSGTARIAIKPSTLILGPRKQRRINLTSGDSAWWSLVHAC